MALTVNVRVVGPTNIGGNDGFVEIMGDATGGTPDYTYEIDQIIGDTAILITNSWIAQHLSAGNYRVTVTDSSVPPVVRTQDYAMADNPPLNADTQQHMASEYGVNDASIDVELTHGTAPNTCKVFCNGNEVQFIPDLPDNFTISDLTVGSYRLTISDSSDPQKTVDTVIPIIITSPPYAVIHGQVNPEGKTVEVFFEIGTDTTYGHTIDIGVFGGVDNVPVYYPLSADYGANAPGGFLLPNTTYHYRIKVTYGTQVIYGGDLTFNTPSYIPTAETLPATDIH